MCRDGWTCAKGGGVEGAGGGCGVRGGAACLTVRASACTFERERKGGGGVAQGWGKGPSLQDQHKWNCIDSVNCRVGA